MISNGRVHINFISERVRILIARFKYADRGDISFRPPIVEYRMVRDRLIYELYQIFDFLPRIVNWSARSKPIIELFGRLSGWITVESGPLNMKIGD